MSTIISVVEQRHSKLEAYADSLDTQHEALAPLGISWKTLRTFQAGYSTKAGQSQGRLAIAICDRHGAIIGFCGRALNDEERPLLKFSNGIDPEGIIFNTHRVGAGELYLLRDPLAVLRAYEDGVTNCVSLLTDSITPMQFRMLAALLDEKNASYMEMY